MEYRVRRDEVGVEGHLQCVDDEAGAHVRGELPADDHAGGQVDHGGQVEPALAGSEVGDVADQPLAGRAAGRVEVTADQIRGLDRVLPRDRGAPVAARLHRPQAQFAHQIGDQPHRAFVPVPIQRGGDTPAAGGLPRLVEHPSHLDRQPPASGRGGCLDPVTPGVETRPGHPEQLTHPGDRVVSLLRLDQRATLS